MNETAAAPGDASTASKAQLNEKSADGEGEKALSKERLADLEKKEWCKMKDIIFDSEE